MHKTLFVLRIVFLLLCAAGAWLLAYSVEEWDEYRGIVVLVGVLLGVLTILVDVLLKGFSLRGLSVLTFGLAMGAVVAWLISSSPLFDGANTGTKHLFRLALFAVCTYLGAVIALRGRDEFNLVIPYVRFVPHEVDVPLVVLDTSALIDGRIAHICETHFLTAALVIPRFVLQELQAVADSHDPVRAARGRRGLEVLNELKKIKNLDLRIHESDVVKRSEVDAKLVFLAQSMKAKLLTTDYNLAQMAEFHGVPWLNLTALHRALRVELRVGERIEIDLVKPGKEEGQAVGFLEDGSMVVVAGGRALVGKRTPVEVTSVLPSSGGKMIFGRVEEG